VESPISCFAKEDRAPVLILLLLFISSELKNAHRSGRFISCILSKITMPQLLHIISPKSGSVTILSLLHIEHIIGASIIRVITRA
jgi:hypothetical protein